MYDLVVRDGKVFTGAGNPWFKADVAVKDGRIVEVGKMLGDAKDLQNAGADIVLLECVPSALGAEITRSLDVPVIGIGAGPGVDGQVLVLYDILDLTPGRKPRFTRNFMEGAASPLAALEAYVRAVKDGSYPAPEHCF